MNRTDVGVMLKNGERRVVGGYLVAPGLAVHRGVPLDGLGDLTNDWMVTHLMSGNFIGGSFRLRKDAERAGKEFAALTDWTQEVGALANVGLTAKINAIRFRILAESDGLVVGPRTHQETTPLLNEPVRATHLLYGHEVSKLNQQFVERFESSLVRTEIEVLTDRIKKGEKWLALTGHGVPETRKATKLLADLKARLARVRYETELPAEVLGFINALVYSTTAYNLRIPGAYVRVVIPDVLTFEADLIYEDIPF